MTEGANGQVITTVTVMRDSFGMKGDGSLRDDFNTDTELA